MIKLKKKKKIDRLNPLQLCYSVYTSVNLDGRDGAG